MPPEQTWTVAARTHRIVVAAAYAAVVVAGILTFWPGVTPWIFLAIFGIATILTIAPWVGWSTATWSAVGGTLLIAQWVMVINPYLGLRLDTAQIVVMLVALLPVALLAVRADGPREYPRPRIVDTVAALAPALASGILLLVAGWIRGAASVTWAMTGDAQYNTVLARIIAQEGGATFDNVDVIALAQGLMAMSHLPGRELVGADGLLVHDIVRQADLWILLILLASVLGGAIAARVLARAATGIRVVAILGAAIIPLTWHLTGFAISAGFYNTDLAYLALELVVYFWLVTANRPWVRLAVLGGLTTVLLGAWTPLGIIPLTLIVVGFLRTARRRPSVQAGALVAVSAAQVMAFGLLFILPTFIASGAALSHPGGIVGLPRYVVAAVMVVLLALGVLVFTDRKARDREFAVGSMAFVVGALLGVGFLYFQNRHLVDPWIYYPIKFAWISLEVMLVLIWIAIGLLVTSTGVRRVIGIAATFAVAIAAIGIAVINPPKTGTPLGYLPLVQIALDPPEMEDSLETLSDYAGERVLFFHYTEDDPFMNQWQFQLTVRHALEPIRSFAYRPVVTEADFCEAAQAWGGEVTVITADPAKEQSLEATCSEYLDAIVLPAP